MASKGHSSIKGFWKPSVCPTCIPVQRVHFCCISFSFTLRLCLALRSRWVHVLHVGGLWLQKPCLFYLAVMFGARVRKYGPSGLELFVQPTLAMKSKVQHASISLLPIGRPLRVCRRGLSDFHYSGHIPNI